MTKDLQKRVIFGGIALLFFIPTVMVGGVFFQIVIGLIAMLGVHELLKMKGLETATFEGALAMLAAFATDVEKDQASLKNGVVKFDNTVSLKEKLFKKLLQQTDSFKTSIFK